jgi:hypothetical protein
VQDIVRFREPVTESDAVVRDLELYFDLFVTASFKAKNLPIGGVGAVPTLRGRQLVLVLHPVERRRGRQLQRSRKVRVVPDEPEP